MLPKRCLSIDCAQSYAHGADSEDQYVIRGVSCKSTARLAVKNNTGVMTVRDVACSTTTTPKREDKYSVRGPLLILDKISELFNNKKFHSKHPRQTQLQCIPGMKDNLYLRQCEYLGVKTRRQITIKLHAEGRHRIYLNNYLIPWLAKALLNLRPQRRKHHTGQLERLVPRTTAQDPYEQRLWAPFPVSALPSALIPI